MNTNTATYQKRRLEMYRQESKSGNYTKANEHAKALFEQGFPVGKYIYKRALNGKSHEEGQKLLEQDPKTAYLAAKITKDKELQKAAQKKMKPFKAAKGIAAVALGVSLVASGWLGKEYQPKVQEAVQQQLTAEELREEMKSSTSYVHSLDQYLAKHKLKPETTAERELRQLKENLANICDRLD
jgi:hypothetical protein